jgi:hypothetical protein
MINLHDKYAPYWAGTLIILMVTGLSTIWFKAGSFWNGYVLDMTGPAWTYILFRGLFTAKADNKWTRFFTPARTLIILLAVAYGIETLQYFKVYDSTFDPLDIVAYSSVLVPIFIIDQFLTKSP